jgi:2-polyprenyl-3-methyl-5-hydroxy-6-metoxy-1,4-benzoquinol methylase
METIGYCFACHSPAGGEPYMDACDHLVTQQFFSMQRCKQCGFVFTNPRPHPEEIVRYYQSGQYTSHSEKATNLFESIYLSVRRQMVNKKVGMVKRYLQKGASILDIGCGTGLFLQSLHTKGYRVMGVEPGEKAAQLASEKGITVVRSMVDVTAENHAGYDLISMWHVLEHVHNLPEHLQQCKQLLKPGGILVVAVPMCNSFDALFYKQHWAAYDLPRHLWHFTPDTLKLVVQKTGLQQIRVRRMPVDAFYIAILSEQYKKSRCKPLAFVRAMLIGMWSNAAAVLTAKPASSQVFVFQK